VHLASIIPLKNDIDKRQCGIQDKISIKCKDKYGKTLMLHKGVHIEQRCQADTQEHTESETSICV